MGDLELLVIWRMSGRAAGELVAMFRHLAVNAPMGSNAACYWAEQARRLDAAVEEAMGRGGQINAHD